MEISRGMLRRSKPDSTLDRFWPPLRDLLGLLEATPAGLGFRRGEPATAPPWRDMFSMAAASLYLPFLPMLPTQIPLNIFLSDISQISVPGENVDPALLHKPKR